MSYPMTYTRVLQRNRLEGDYENPGPPPGDLSYIRGDLRRLEQDTVDERHLAEYAEIAGCHPEQVRRLFESFFGGGPWEGPHRPNDWEGVTAARRVAYAREMLERTASSLAAAEKQLAFLRQAISSARAEIAQEDGR